MGQESGHQPGSRSNAFGAYFQIEEVDTGLTQKEFGGRGGRIEDGAVGNGSLTGSRAEVGRLAGLGGRRVGSGYGIAAEVGGAARGGEGAGLCSAFPFTDEAVAVPGEAKHVRPQLRCRDPNS